MTLEDLKIQLLRSRPDLLEETARFVNKEWPRSLSARMSSLHCSPGGASLPCSLVMTASVGMETREKVIGHARLMPVLGRPNAALIETVLVDPLLRGCGLGRGVMEETEAHARSVGMDVIHLSTHDKQTFYSHLGYTNGPVVSPQRSCVTKLGDKADFLDSIAADRTEAKAIHSDSSHHDHTPLISKAASATEYSSTMSQLSPSVSSSDQTSQITLPLAASVSSASETLPPPAPPPPPPPPPQPSLEVTSNRITWMMKIL